MVSPKYDMQSLREGRVQAIDVFEDAIQGWLLDYASRLAELKEDRAGLAVMVLIAAYPETIECYSTGTDSKNQSRRFFTNGMKRVFPELGGLASDDVLGSLCDDLRNGLYHASMLKGSVVLRPEGSAVGYSSEEQLFMVNPFEFLRRVQAHFAAYVSRLRTASDGDEELAKFHQYWKLRHSVTEGVSAAAPSEESVASERVLSTAAPIDARKSTRRM